MPDAGRPKNVQAAANALGSEQLAAVRDAGQTRVTGDPECLGEVLCAATALVVGEPEPDDPGIGVARCQPGERARIEGVARAVCTHDHPDRQTG